jgi:nitronate monooxygenase
MGLMDDIPTCAELLERMVAECREAMQAGMRAFNA